MSLYQKKTELRSVQSQTEDVAKKPSFTTSNKTRKFPKKYGIELIYKDVENSLEGMAQIKNSKSLLLNQSIDNLRLTNNILHNCNK